MNTVYRLRFSPAARRSLGTALLACAISWPGVTTYAESQPAPPPQQQIQPGNKALLTQADLKELVGPIALYPDALIAMILPASTVPADVVLGARFVDSKADPAQAGNQPWDDSVKSLVYYPDVLSWMNENLEWTSSLGEAFMDQPADVMNAIQALRLQAKASGALTDTPQQRVVVQQDTVRIIPADPEVIYVPQYDPEVIFVDSYAPGYTPFITFGIGFAVGSWLNYDCDWRDRCVYRGDWIGWDRGGRGWDRGGDVFINNTDINVNVVNINSTNATRWSPSNRAVRQLSLRQRNGGGNARFTRAEAREARDMIRTERRDNNGKLSASALAAARRDALPAPSKLQLRDSAFNRTARTQTSGDRKENREALQNNPAALAEARKDRRDDATPNRPNAAERQEMRRKTPTEAPRVAGQIEAPRQQQARSEQRQNVRQQTEDRTVNRPNRLDRDVQVPTRAPQLEDSDRPSNRPSVSERQTESRQSMQNFRQERSEQRESPSVDRPQRQERSSPPKVQRQERQESQPRVNREPQRQQRSEPQRQQRSERPQPQRQERREVRQESRPQRQEARQENRSANRPERQERSEKKSDDGGDRKKKD